MDGWQFHVHLNASMFTNRIAFLPQVTKNWLKIETADHPASPEPGPCTLWSCDWWPTSKNSGVRPIVQPCVCLCVCVSVSLCLCVCVSVCVSVCLCLCVSVCVSLSVCLCLCVSVSLSFCLCLCVSACLSQCVCLCVSVFVSLSISLCLCLSLSLCVFVRLCVFLCVCLYVSVCLCVCLCVCVCVCVRVYLSLCVCLCVCLFFSLRPFSNKSVARAGLWLLFDITAFERVFVWEETCACSLSHKNSWKKKTWEAEAMWAQVGISSSVKSYTGWTGWKVLCSFFCGFFSWPPIFSPSQSVW